MTPGSGEILRPDLGCHHALRDLMLCETCRWTERPGFIRRPQPSVSAEFAGSAAPERETADFVPCPDCGGQAIAHCCEGLCAQPEPDGSGADA